MTDKSRDLVKQLLLAKRSYVVGGHTKHEWVNPDGPIAADLIETQAREIERLREALTAVYNEGDFASVRIATLALGAAYD